jgi:hypothetical protein
VGAGQSLHHFTGPVVAMAVMGILILLLKWTFGRGSSLVEHTPRTGAPSDYGLLVSVAAPEDWTRGEALRRQLTEHGIPATLVRTSEGPRVMVWPDDEQRARRVLEHPPG